MTESEQFAFHLPRLEFIWMHPALDGEMIQRRLQIGFNRASRLVERMEKDGIVGAANGSKPREVLAQAI